jgi:hypothetical protein
MSEADDIEAIARRDAGQKRRDAITAWWEGMALRRFIAAKRAALTRRTSENSL